ncbi:hypothetical protein AaE_008773, partial [Aphanomyces astaci]
MSGDVFPRLDRRHSLTDDGVYDVDVCVYVWRCVVNESDLRALYKRFSKSDKEVLRTHTFSANSGSIDRTEFFRSFKEERTAVGDAVFALIDIDNSGQLDFSEYVEALGAFCLLNTDEILKFCFFVFDQDKNGTIEGV